MPVNLDESSSSFRIFVISILIIISCLLTYYFHFVLGKGIVFSQFYYIPIILAAFWWKRKGILVSLFLASLLLLTELITPVDVFVQEVLRAIILVSVSVITVFISEKIEKTQIKLAISEEKYRNIVETTHEGIVVGDIQGTILYVNQRMCELLGYEREEMENHNIFEFTPEDERDILVETRKKVAEGERIAFYPEFRRKDGSKLWTLAQASPLYDDQGQYMANLYMHSDITELKKARKALEVSYAQLENKVEERTRELNESEEKYRKLFEKNPDYNILFDTNGVIREVNEATVKMMGLSKDEIVGKKFTELESIPPENVSSILGELFRILEGKEIKPFESKFIDGNGDIHYIIIHAIPFLEKGKVERILGIGADITQLKKAENKILSSLSEKEALLREIHHRVNNNMQIISSLLNLQTLYVHEEETKEVLQDSQRRVKSMAMVHEKLYRAGDLSHIKFKEYTEKLVSDIFSTYNRRTGDIKFILNMDEIELNMETAIPLGLIINELVTNSLKFAFPENEGSITIELENNNGQFVLTVADDGIGLPPDFDLNKTHSLGLRLVNSLVIQLDGEISMDSSQGAEYKITFRELDYSGRF